MATIGTLDKISAPKLSELLLEQAASGGRDVAVIDVRDDDHVGGHIKTSTHAPSGTLDTNMPTIVRHHKETPIVVFHCALSQVRGPKAALLYLRERERLYPTSIGSAMAKSAAESDERKAAKTAEAGDWQDVQEVKEEQKVYVLHEGFQGWQAKYGEDERLTEAYSKELWSDDY